MLTGKLKLSALKCADIFVLPSYFDNFPISLIEAMCVGLPVVLTKGVGIWNIVKENESGIVVESNPESIAEGISYLLLNPEKRNQLGNNGRETAEREFSIQRVTDQMINVYKDIIK